METQPVVLFELIEKEGYITDTIMAFNKYVGGMKKGTHWKMDTIYLKKIRN